MKDLQEFELLWREGHFNINDEEIGSTFRSTSLIENKFTFMNQSIQDVELMKLYQEIEVFFYILEIVLAN
jgi:hypothetical protein